MKIVKSCLSCRTLFGHLGNMHASDECINPESSCDNASTACKQSFDDALELSNQELDVFISLPSLHLNPFQMFRLYFFKRCA